MQKKTIERFYLQSDKRITGARASMTVELHLDYCRIPSENIIGTVGTGLTYVALTSLDYGRYTSAWGGVSLGHACLEASVRYSRKRKQFGGPLIKNQLIQKMITEILVNIKAARINEILEGSTQMHEILIGMDAF